MSPRAKSTLIVTAILLALLPTLYLIAARVITQGFGELEIQEARQHIQRATGALDSEMQELDSKTADWASRNGTYEFLAGLRPSYMEASLFPNKVLNLRVNLVAFLDAKRRVVAAKSYTGDNGLPTAPPIGLDAILAQNSQIIPNREKNGGSHGILFIQGAPMMVSVYPVTMDNPNTISNGYILFGRLLDQSEIQRLADTTQLLLEVRRIDAPDLGPDFTAALPSLAREPVFTRALDEKTFAAYRLLPDVQGVPRLILRAQFLRTVYQQSRATLTVFLLSLIGIGLLTGIFGQSVVERLMVSQKVAMENVGRYRAVVEQISEGMLQVDAQSKTITEANPAFAALLDYDAESLVGVPLYDIIAQERDELEHDLRDTGGEGRHMIGERRYRRRDGSLIDVEESASRYSYKGREVLVVVVRDITARKQAEKDLRESEERYQLAAHGANDGLWDWNLKTNEIYFSSRWKSMLGYEESEINGHPEEWFSLVHPEDLPELQMQLDAHLKGATSHFQSEHRMRHHNGEYRWMLNRGMAVWGEDGYPHRMAGSLTDITDRKTSEEQFRHDALHDALTELPNRALFMDRLGQAVERSKRRPDYLFGLLFLDFDRFKIINDSLGHSIGDQLLIAGARRLEACLRTMDTIARLGGDEFVILLEYIESTRDAIRVAERIDEALEPAFAIDGHEIFITASTGIVLSSIGYENAEDMLRDADIAMYRSKALGRARYELFNPELRSQAMARLELETDMRRALERKEFFVHYQPILSLTDNRISGFEALIRWRHPTLGNIPPNDFIPLAEETGLILPIGNWVLREACRQMKEWQDRYPGLPYLTISVNMSGKQFNQPELAEEIRRVLDETGLDISSLRLEITESVMMEAVESTTNLLKQLKMMGVQLEIDDFGTGYSSLAYLQQLPIDAIKIDRSFIRQMNLGGNDQGIVQAIIAMAHNLGMHVIAEGVEASDQLDRLKAMECELAQGFLFHRPLDTEAVADLLTTFQGQQREDIS